MVEKQSCVWKHVLVHIVYYKLTSEFIFFKYLDKFQIVYSSPC